MAKQKETKIYFNLQDLANDIRSSDCQRTIIFAHNGVGKTRLSMEYKGIGTIKDGDGNTISGDTLYFNAYTEDLFTWDNDLKEDKERNLIINTQSHFFDGLTEEDIDIESKIRPFLHRYVDFNFKILPVDEKHKQPRISFIKEVIVKNGDADRAETQENIKISRGEETIFIWCFFLAILQMTIDEHDKYKWVKHIYIDDPVSSLDDNHAIAIGAHLAQILKKDATAKRKVIISTHHGLFFNVMYNEFQRANTFFLKKLTTKEGYSLISTRDTPFFHHVVMMQMLQKAVDTRELYTYHFNILRNLMEKTAAFHGYSRFRDCITLAEDEMDSVVYGRMIDIMNHGNYSIFSPTEMQDENKDDFSIMVKKLRETYKFNDKLFDELEIGEDYGHK